MPRSKSWEPITKEINAVSNNRPSCQHHITISFHISDLHIRASLVQWEQVTARNFFPPANQKRGKQEGKSNLLYGYQYSLSLHRPPPSTVVPPRLSEDGGRTNEAFRGCLIILLTYRSDQQRLACRPSAAAAAAAARLTEDMSVCSTGSSSFMDMEWKKLELRAKMKKSIQSSSVCL